MRIGSFEENGISTRKNGADWSIRENSILYAEREATV